MMREVARVDALFQSGLLAPRPAELSPPWMGRSKGDQLRLPFEARIPARSRSALALSSPRNSVTSSFRFPPHPAFRSKDKRSHRRLGCPVSGLRDKRDRPKGGAAKYLDTGRY